MYGRNHSEEVKRKLSEHHKGKTIPLEVRRKISNTIKEKYKDTPHFNLGRKHSEETKRKISEAQLGEKNHMYGKRGELNATSKKVIELTTGKIYNSAMLAADDLQLEFSHVCSVARGDRGSHKGYVFRYLDKNDKPIKNQYQATIKFKKVKENVLPQFLYLL